MKASHDQVLWIVPIMAVQMNGSFLTVLVLISGGLLLVAHTLVIVGQLTRAPENLRSGWFGLVRTLASCRSL